MFVRDSCTNGRTDGWTPSKHNASGHNVGGGIKTAHKVEKQRECYRSTPSRWRAPGRHHRQVDRRYECHRGHAIPRIRHSPVQCRIHDIVHRVSKNTSHFYCLFNAMHSIRQSIKSPECPCVRACVLLFKKLSSFHTPFPFPFSFPFSFPFRFSMPFPLPPFPFSSPFLSPFLSASPSFTFRFSFSLPFLPSSFSLSPSSFPSPIPFPFLTLSPFPYPFPFSFSFSFSFPYLSPSPFFFSLPLSISLPLPLKTCM